MLDLFISRWRKACAIDRHSLSQKTSSAHSDSLKYSKAFELFVLNGEDDLEGLLAYARYKQMIRDHVRQGLMASGAVKNPSDEQIIFFRESAASELARFAAQAIDEAREEIQNSATLQELKNTKEEIKNEISYATGFGRSIATNFIGWLVTVFVMVLVYFGLSTPAIPDLINKIKNKSETSSTLDTSSGSTDPSQPPPIMS